MSRLGRIGTLALVLAASAVSSASPAFGATPKAQIAKVKKAVSRYANEQKGQLRTLRLDRTTNPSGLTILCPYSLSCPSADYSLFVRTNEEGPASVLINFDKNDLANLDLVELRRTFDYLTYTIDFGSNFNFPSFDIESPGIGNVIRRENIESWELTGFENGRLRGRLTSRVSEIWIRRNDKWAERNCNVADAPPPAGCLEMVDADIPVQVEFELDFPRSPIDCTDVSFPTPGCG